jgi:ABC-type polar amino acid transport system ATPase subunit
MNALLRITDLGVRFGTRDVLRDLSLEVRRGEIVALMGPSGVGKSTALRAVAALQRFDAGRIDVDGFTLEPGPVPPQSRLTPLRRQVGLVFQAHALFEHLSARDNVTLALRHVLGKSDAEAESTARALLDSLDVGARADAWPRQLSGGEAQRVAIARALALDPALLLLDEPTAALDQTRRGALSATLKALAKGGRGLLVATHDVEFARGTADRVVSLTTA